MLDDRYAFLDIGPLSKGHCLVIPKCASIRLAPTVTRLAEEGSLAAAQTTARSCTTSLMTTSCVHLCRSHFDAKVLI